MKRTKILLENHFLQILLALLFIAGTNRAQGQQQRLPFEQVKALLHQPPSGGYVMVVAHRGDWRNAPENSLQAVENCIKMGVDMVEIDLQLTKDSVIVIMHDSKLNRSSTGKGKIADYTYEELKRFRLRDGLGRPTPYPIPTLEAVMRIAKGKILVNLDKAENFLPLLYPVLKRTGTMDQVVVGAYLTLPQMQASAGALLDSLLFMPKIKEGAAGITGYLDAYEHKLDFNVLQAGFTTDTSAVAVNLKKWGQQYRSWVWVNAITPDRCGNHDDELGLTSPEDAYGWLLSHGATIIQTDRPRKLIHYLEGKGYRGNRK